MPATMTTPKAKPAARVSDDPRVQAAQARYISLRDQSAATAAEVERLRNLGSENAHAAAVKAVLGGANVDAAIEGATRKEALAAAEKRLSVLNDAVADTQREFNLTCADVAREIIDAEQPALNARLEHVAQSVRGTLQAVADLHEFLQAMSARGVTVDPSRWRGLLTNPHTVALFHLPNPGAAAGVYQKYVEHVAKHFPAVARNLDSELE